MTDDPSMTHRDASQQPRTQQDRPAHDPQNAKPGRPLWTATLWLFIIAFTAFLAVMAAIGGPSTAETLLPDPTKTASMQIDLQTRTTVGLQQLSSRPELIASLLGDDDPAELRDALVVHPVDEPRFAIFAIQLQPDRAQTAIDTARAALNGYTQGILDLAPDAADTAPDTADAGNSQTGTRAISPISVDIANNARAQGLAWALALDEGLRREVTQQAPAWRDGLLTDLDLIERVYVSDNSDQRAGKLTEDERERLATRHGWVGRFAAAHQLDDSAPEKTELLNEAFNTAALLAAAGIVILLGVVVSIGFAVTAFVMLAMGKVRSRLTAPVAIAVVDRQPLLESFALFFLAFFGVSLAAAVVEQLTGVRALFLYWLALLPAFWPLLRGMSWFDLRMSLGWHTNGKGAAGFAKETLLGIAGYLACLPMVVVALVISLLIVSLTGLRPTHPIQEQAQTQGLLNALSLYMLACLWAPIVEETFFRGALYFNMRGLAPRSVLLSALFSAAVTGFIFAIIHPQGVALVPALMALGMTFAFIREWRGSLIGPIVAHALHNGVIVTLLLAMT